MEEEKIIEQYENVTLYFMSYYKYEFEFSGETINGDTIDVTIGGDRDDIYRMSITSNETISSLLNEGVRRICINNKEIYSNY